MKVIKSLEIMNIENLNSNEFEDYLMRILYLDLIKLIDDYERNILNYNISWCENKYFN